MAFPATSGSLTHQSADGHVRTVKLAIADSTLDNKGRRIKPLKVLKRPVQKLVLLQEASETVHPRRGATNCIIINSTQHYHTGAVDLICCCCG